MATETVQIVIKQSGAKQVKRNIEEVGNAAQKSQKGVSGLTNLLRGLATSAGLAGVIRLADSYNNLQNRLRSTGLAGSELTSVYQTLLKVSNDTFSSVQSSVDLYARLAVSSKELGTSQQELINFTDRLNKSVILSGASAAEAEAGITQLSQGLASGSLRGDELRSVLEQLPRVADVIAKSMGATRGELRKLGAEGKITAQEVLKAFRDLGDEIDDQFKQIVPTIGQSFQVLKNNVVDFVGRAAESSGATALLSKSLVSLANNLDIVAAGLAAVGTSLVIMKAGPAIIGAVTGAVRLLTATVAANPLGALAVATLAAASALTVLRHQIRLGTDEVSTLGDFMSAIGESLRELATAASTALQPLVEGLQKIVPEFELTWAGALRSTARFIDNILGYFAGIVRVYETLFDRLPNAFDDVFSRAFGNMVQAAETGVNAVIKALSYISEAAGLGSIKPIELVDIVNLNEGAAKKLGFNMGEAFLEGVKDNQPLTDFVEGRLARAGQLAQERLARQAAANRQSPSTEAGQAASKAADNTKLIDSLQSLVRQYDSVYKAQQTVAEATRTLTQATSAGLITADEQARIQGLVNTQLRDSLDPLGAVMRSLREERQILGESTEEQRVNNQVRQITADLRQQGISLTYAELAGLQSSVSALQAETAEYERRNDIIAQSGDRQTQFSAELQTTSSLIEEGLVRQTDAVERLIGSYELTYDRIAQLRAADVIDEQKASQLKFRLFAESNRANLRNQSEFFGNLSSLSRVENRRIAAIGKAAAISQATIDGVLAVQKALASAPPPASFALAAAAGAAAAVNVASIASQTPGFAFGGDFTVGGQGGTDSQLVAFRATPGEQVKITTPTQDRAEAANGASTTAGDGGIQVKIINALDPEIVGDYLATAEGQQVLVNTIRRNASSVKRVLQ